MKRGAFITIEGPEGSGKSTHSRLLCDFLRRRGFNLVHTREPGGTEVSEAVRKILLNSANRGMSDTCELFLFLAARAELVEKIIIPALKNGCVVVCDRFHDATVAYQGYGARIDLKLIEKTGRLATTGLKPNLTILLDVETKQGLRRAGIKDRIETKSIDFHRKVRRGYLKIAKDEPRRVKLIDTTKADIKEVQDKIRQIVLDVL